MSTTTESLANAPPRRRRWLQFRLSTLLLLLVVCALALAWWRDHTDLHLKLERAYRQSEVFEARLRLMELRQQQMDAAERPESIDLEFREFQLLPALKSPAQH